MYQNKVAMIIGAAGDIGKAMAMNFANLKYDLVLLDLQEELLSNLQSIIESKHNNIKIYRGFIDIRLYTEVNQVIGQMLTLTNRIDVLFNAAGICIEGTNEINPSDFLNTIMVNLVGTFNCIHSVVPLMKQQKSGYIFNMGSRQGLSAGGLLGAYAASKFGVVGLTEAYARELASDGIKVTALCPGFINTRMNHGKPFPTDKMIDLQDITKTVNYLLSLSSPATVKQTLIECSDLL